MEHQHTFFNTQPEPSDIEPCDPHVSASDRPRLGGQNAAILARLRQGPATNSELSCISLKYTSRISDLRAAGYDVRCHSGQGGLNTYVLQEFGGDSNAT